MSAGRGYALALGLTYSSGAGNGPFGIGWQMGTNVDSTPDEPRYAPVRFDR
ncbi:SpvB/TcaC N-terminal domain-containing protein [Burkholderia stabilis]|uniref:SpvB/TcaC N-terminal domain-containing protein n=1 Tax=Burkholderia stabilis TaxID=95485 RepID=UPI0023EA76DF|nr:SpvB/TcaC N-terminal domain-containing protein [Burkholderia stabilis]